ncbi:MAG: dienelactone hydrolase family protein [Solirubrobacterales bacterium]|nr:dienelactone hydrolase family protein [Solirubrobacterales bacterium]MBV9715508.1 dienelactone hydrolase family protein [Solirubrobacterales bacterium]
MHEQEMRVHTPDGEMTTVVVHPDDGAPFPVAVLYMDAVGYREQLKANARRFAADGYYCVVLDLFYRSGEQLTFDMDKLRAGGFQGPDAERLMSIISSLTPGMVASDTRAVLEAIGSDPAASSGPKVCVGYCMGARFALHVVSALADEFVAAAGIHPGAPITDRPDSPHHDLPGVRGELYFAFAESDRFPPELVDQFRDELERNGVRGVVERIPGTEHGFSMADLPVYQREAAERHFERTLDLWRRNLAHQAVNV